MRVQRTRARRGWVYEEVGVSDRETDLYTVFCVMPDAPDTDMGAYDEEIRVAARDAEHALEVAAGAIALDYDERLRPKIAEKHAVARKVP